MGVSDTAPTTAVAAETQYDDEGTHHIGGSLATLMLGATGVVFGDIGTSPLYAFREALAQSGADGIDPSEILGTLSLALWTLTHRRRAVGLAIFGTALAATAGLALSHL